MQVTRLEIFGFKSFVERFVLNFDHNFIGIVGPNGCGKSNVVDSLRWVLGETHARHLRGTVLDDLIFSGSETRRPLGMAEVSITIRPTIGWQEMMRSPIEIAASERAVVNGQPVVDHERNEPIHSSAETNGGGALTPLVAEDGGDPAENTGAEIDISGVETAAALQVMSDVAELGEKGEIPRPAIFTEIPGLLEAAEVQFTRRLYRSGESEYFINRVPCRLRDMLDIYRLIGLGARGLSIVEQGEIGQFISKKPIERRELLEEAAGISGFRTKMEAAQRKLERTSENLARLRDIIIEVEKQVRVLSRQAKRARERKELKSELKQYEHDLYLARTAKVRADQQAQIQIQDQLEGELERLRSELAVSEAEQGELRAHLETFDVTLADVRRERDGLQLRLAQERDRLNDLKVELAKLAGKRESLIERAAQCDVRSANNHEGSARRTARAEELRERAARLEVEQTSIQTAIEQLGEEELARKESQAELFDSHLEYPRQTEIREELERLQPEVEQLGEVSSAVTQAEREVREAQSQLDTRTRSVQQQRVAMARVESELRSLEAQLDAFAEHVTRAAGAGDLLGSGDGVNRVLLAGIRVPEDLQTALSAVLGDRDQYLLTASATQLGQRYAERRTGQRDQQPVKIGVIDESSLFSPGMSSAEATPLSEAELGSAPSAKPLLDCIVVDEPFRAAASILLGEFVLVDTFEEALRLNAANVERGAPRRSLVTRSGEVVTPWGWFTTQGKGKAFGFTRRMAEQKDALAKHATDLEHAESELVVLEETLAARRRTVTERQEHRERLLGLERRLHALRREEHELKRQIEAKMREEERRQRELIVARERELQGQLRRITAEGAQVRSEIEFELRQAASLLRENEELSGERARMIAESEEIARQEEELRVHLVSNEDDGNNQLAQLREGCLRCDARIREIEQERDPIRLRLGEISATVAEFRSQTGRIQEQHHRTSMQVERATLELQMFHEEIARAYPDTEPATEAEIEAVLVRAEGDLDAFLTEAQEESLRLRRRIEREGEVDPQSIELFEQEDARLENLRAQCADLEQATAILERTIRQLKEISKARFLHTFQAVSTKFSELIPRLFGGGAGHIALVNPEDPLQSGVEVFVRPPGKKVSNMELLSGGEKALVAISVLIAMFLHRPSPICVLDEVDAPLDEVNLERYLALITEISKSTQFLVITHNKRTMAQAERLVGITMQERGVSTALSVRFDESEAEIDRWIANA